mmetsp:Transcript_33944/g.54455  ORF Transcript_33944/g.54455 Transcript_33944/m.54455 type:complete len:124 (+) Transcript_33944:303-674(+)
MQPCFKPLFAIGYQYVCLYTVAHFMERIPKSARDLLDGTCAYRMEMIGSLNGSARKRLGYIVSEKPELKTIMSERQSVYDRVQKAVCGVVQEYGREQDQHGSSGGQCSCNGSAAQDEEDMQQP